MRLEVLGPVRAWHGDVPLSLGPVQQRVVLAVLALHANRPVGRDVLIDAVWGSAAPTYAVNLVQKHVSGLRRVLEPVRSARAPSQVLTWTDAGYLLALPEGCLDLAVFDREVGRARAARAVQDLPGAAQALHAALRLWRGPAFDGLESPLLDAERDRLAERHIDVLEDRIEVDLAVGAGADLVAELRQLVAAYPLRERLRGLLMTALYRSGRQAEALAAYREAHQYLVDELGVEPSAPLRELHQRILAADASLSATSAPIAAGGPRTAGTPTPAQLPHGMPDFTGRAAELDRLDALLDDDGDGRAVVITAIAGTAGVGKTSLAVHWAHRVSGRFPDGQLYVNLRGFDQNGAAVEPGDAVRGFLDAFGVPAQRIPGRLDEQSALYRSLLAGRRVLVVLDNARDSDQVRPLLPGAPDCLAVITSRNRLAGLVAAGAVPIPVDLLTVDEARRMLTHRIGRERVEAEPEAVDDIVTACARLPLALAIVAARAAVHPRFSLAALAGELRQARGGLDAFVGENAADDARAVLSWSYQALGPDAARLFRLLGLHPGPDLAVPAAASLAGVPVPHARRLLAELSAAHLLEERTPGRFGFHDLLRAYAAEQAQALDDAADRTTAIRRVLDHYLYTAHRADRLLYPYRARALADPPDPAATVVDLADPDEAEQWLMTEHPVLLSVIDLAKGHGFDVHTCELAWSITAFLNYQGQWQDWATSLTAALGACRRRADRAGEALTERLLNLAYLQQRLPDAAETHARRALDLYAALGDRAGEARVHLDLGRVAERQEDYHRALDEVRRGLELFRLAGDTAGEADALNWVGWYHSCLGRHEEALTYCRQSLGLHEGLHDRPGLADTWNSLGYAHLQLGHPGEAVAAFTQGLALWEGIGDRYEVATLLNNLGDAQSADGDVDAARTSWSRARDIFAELGHPLAEPILVKLEKA